MVAPIIVLGLRGVQALFSIIVLGLTAYRMSLFLGISLCRANSVQSSTHTMALATTGRLTA